jgi:hypothetical protein
VFGFASLLFPNPRLRSARSFALVRPQGILLYFLYCGCCCLGFQCVGIGTASRGRQGRGVPDGSSASVSCTGADRTGLPPDDTLSLGIQAVAWDQQSQQQTVEHKILIVMVKVRMCFKALWNSPTYFVASSFIVGKFRDDTL